MKIFFKKIVLFLLVNRAKFVIASRPEIIAITGSMGKTTTKKILGELLSKQYSVLVSKSGFNTPIGVLLTLLGEQESGFSSFWEWTKILWRVYRKTLPRPEKIILEFGVDRVGDMDELLKILVPQVAVVTNVFPVHLGEGLFRNEVEIAHEKGKLAKAVSQEGLVLLFADNEYTRNMAETTRAKTVLYGFEQGEVRISPVVKREDGISFSLFIGEEVEEFFAPVFGNYFSEMFVPAIILARRAGISLNEIRESISNFSPPAGRGRVFLGKGGSKLWDNSYNSSPEALSKALNTFVEIPVAGRRIALLGTMNELGDRSHEFHVQIGKKAAETADILFFVGKYYSAFKEGVLAVDSEKPVQSFQTPIEAGNAILPLLQEGDLLLVKGSQNGVFLEKAIEILLEKSEDISLLCRRGEGWKKEIRKEKGL
jgi:UDP-N-acetylmuramyl pentapeptide synthase